MLADSEPQEECDQSWNWVTVGKAKQNGGSEIGSNPHVRKKDTVVYLSDAECSYPPKEGPLPPVEGWHHTLKRSNQNQQPVHEDVPF